MTSTKNVVFDVVGTLASYDHFYDAIESRLGDKMRSAGVMPRLFGTCWTETAEREYTYLSLSGRYVPFHAAIRALFWRILAYCGIAEPRSFATEADLDFMMDGYASLQMRPGAAECVAKLRAAGFTVWGFTAGDLERVSRYFRDAGIHMPPENLLSCDSTGVAKPELGAYRPLLEQLSASGGRPWFAAAHMWDVSAARTAGFRAAYTTVLESEALHELFGDMDVVSDSLPGMADGIIGAE